MLSNICNKPRVLNRNILNIPKFSYPSRIGHRTRKNQNELKQSFNESLIFI
jgi:hypothetical protein